MSGLFRSCPLLQRAWLPPQIDPPFEGPTETHVKGISEGWGTSGGLAGSVMDRAQVIVGVASKDVVTSKIMLAEPRSVTFLCHQR